MLPVWGNIRNLFINNNNNKTQILQASCLLAIKKKIIIIITDLYSAFRSEDTEALEKIQRQWHWRVIVWMLRILVFSGLVWMVVVV